MSNGKNCSKKQLPRQKTVSENNLQLEIRNPRPNELVYATGQTEPRNCIIVRAMVGCNSMLETRYSVLSGSALYAMTAWSSSVVFYEMVSESGEHFAHPRVLEEDRTISKAWRKCESALFNQPLYHWLCITYGEESGEPECAVQYEKTDGPCANPHFRELLDEALRPDAIDTLDHPTVRRLQYVFGDIEEGAPDEWVSI